jgi:redox-sensitive bicupin YhaK (pirin superfamily)
VHPLKFKISFAGPGDVDVGVAGNGCRHKEGKPLHESFGFESNTEMRPGSEP